MGAEKDLNQPQVYAEALARAAIDPDTTRLAVWLAGVESLAETPFAKWYLYFAERLVDLAPRPELGFRPQPRFNTPAPKIGRNDPCPCGSGKKFKGCHLDQESVVAWKLSSPTPSIRAMAVGMTALALPLERLDRVPRDQAGDVALTEMSSAYMQAGRSEQALAVLLVALQGERDDPHVVYDYWIARYAEWLVEAGRYKEAEEFLMDEYDQHRGVEQWQVAQKLAAFYIDQGDVDNGQIWVETALEGDPENPFTYYLDGLLHHGVDQWEAAVAAYEKAEQFSERFQDQERQMMQTLVAEALARARNRQPLEDQDPVAETVDTPLE